MSSSEQGLALWRSQIAEYQKVIARCCNRIVVPLTRFIPDEFEQRVQQVKEILSRKELEEYQQYIDVIVHYVEGTKNKSIIEMADMLTQILGGSLKYWQYIIIDIAEQITYTNQLSIWQVRKLYQQKLYIDSQNLSNHRRLCKLARTYITALYNLIKMITKFDVKKDNLTKVDELFKKVKYAEEKYAGFSQQINGLQNINNLGEFSNNLSQKSKQNALKDLFHYRQPDREKKVQIQRNTLLNYKFTINSKSTISERVSGPTRNIKQTKKAITGSRLQSFQSALKNIKTENIGLRDLQNKFLSLKNPFPIKPSFYNITTIWDRDYYFSYLAYPILIDKFNQFIHPFQYHQWINYQINSDDEYHDVLGEDVEISSQISSVSEDSRNSFIVSDDHLSDDEDIDHQRKQAKPKIVHSYEGRWKFKISDRSSVKILPSNINIDNFSMVSVDSKLKFPLKTEEKNQFQQILMRIVDGKDKVGIMEALSKQKIKISKAKINQFLQKKCRTVQSLDNSNKIIYKIAEQGQQCQIDEKQNITKQSEVITTIDVIDEKNQSDTNLFQPEYFSKQREIGGMKQYKKKKIDIVSIGKSLKSTKHTRGSVINNSNNSV